MSKRPSFQFYPADWRANAKLRRCSDAARGAWIDIMCVLHDSDEYGIVRYQLSDLARAASVSIKLARKLAQNNVLKGSDTLCESFIYAPYHAGRFSKPVTLIEQNQGPCWYCSRMVLDEWRRHRQGLGTRFTADNQPPSRSPIGRVGEPIGMDFGERQGDGSTSSSTSTSVEEDSIVIAKAITPSKSPKGDFEAFWNLCPRKIGKGAGRKAFFKALTKTDQQVLSAAMVRYAVSRKGEPVEFTVYPATWLNQERWLDETGKGNGAAVGGIALDPAVAEQERENLKRMGITQCS